MNVFESGARKMIPAVLVYVWRMSPQGKEFLMLHRDARDRAADYHAGKWNGLGGKLEADESALEAARRELREESGLELPESAFRWLGVLHFPNFKANKGEDWLVQVFAAEAPGSPSAPWAAPLSGPEGSLHWVPAPGLLELNLWAGDRHFIPLVAQGRPFEGTIWYRGDEVMRQRVRTL